MSEIMKLVLLGVVQGVTEFLPISSSGHLAIIGSLLEIEGQNPLELSVILHAGTLLAIVVFYFRELLSLIGKSGFQIVPNLIVGTIPIGVVGYFFHASGLANQMFGSVLFPSIGLVVTASVLIYGLDRKPGHVQLEDISLRQSWWIGLAQALAVLPGISRSGMTISTAIRQGVDKEQAARFSFLLAIPAISGACVVQIASMIHQHHTASLSGKLLIGFGVSAVVGYLSLGLLLATIKKGKLVWYAYYCAFLAAAVIGMTVGKEMALQVLQLQH